MAKKKQPKKPRFTIAPPTPGIEPTGRPLDARAAAKRLNISLNTLYSKCREILIVYYIKGNAFEFYEPHLDDYRQRCRRG